jgi:catechol 2,3-dioxygenase-like lactoylglutathione lyase family enzyme
MKQIAFLGVGLLALGQAQEPVPMTRDKAIYGHVSHLGWVVKDVEAVTRAWRSFGVKAIRDEGVLELPTKYQGAATTLRLRRATGRLGNHSIHWIQPLGGPNALTAYLETHGEGVHHVAFAVPSPDRFDEEVKSLTAAGARLVQDGALTTDAGPLRFAYFDTASRGGGITLELEYNPSSRNTPEVKATPNEDPFNRITQFAFVVRDIKKVSAYWASLGFGSLAIDRNVSLDRRYRDRPGRFEMFLGWNRTGDVPFEWIQPLIGPSVYDEYLAVRPEGFHHLGFNVTDMDAAVARLESAGLRVTMSGGWDTNGHQGRFAYLDAERHGGVTIELLWNKPRS